MSARRLVIALFSAATLLSSRVVSAQPLAPPDEEGEVEGASWVQRPKKPAASTGLGYAIAGSIVLATGLLPAFTVGAGSALYDCATFWGPSQSHLDVVGVPVVGPFLYALDPKRDVAWGVHSSDEISRAQVLALASGVLQIAGLTLITVGMVKATGSRPHPSNGPVFSASNQPRPSITIEPTASRSGGGLSLRLAM